MRRPPNTGTVARVHGRWTARTPWRHDVCAGGVTLLSSDSREECERALDAWLLGNPQDPRARRTPARIIGLRKVRAALSELRARNASRQLEGQL